MPSQPGSWLGHLARIAAGAALAALGLEEFLVPNNIIDGGVVGIAIMLSYLTGWPLGAFIFSLNLPFLLLSRRLIGARFAATSALAVVLLAVFVNFAHPFPPITTDLLLATVFGGLFLGAGVGIIIRAHGATDGVEMMAVLASSRTGFSVGEIIMAVNVLILGSAGFVFGWDRAMYSLMAYYIAFKVIDLVQAGFDESKSALIISTRPEAVGQAVMQELGRPVTYLTGIYGRTGTPCRVIYCIATRLELPRLLDTVKAQDRDAFIVVENVHEVLWGRPLRRPAPQQPYNLR